MKLEWILLFVALVALAGTMVAFGWYIIFPLAIFGGSLAWALKRLNVVRW
jgi:hypothetical protein